ncbi:RHS repeat-associated core domain-containing protein [Chryseobacterium lactis]|uniref:RHS repeat-associated core domain-containing protein n=1 Tax=Chryseobacterium lactis TaxID=1241981 RepID=UPI0021AB63A3|nr:RHS repeat-associated core domain-containing protein [Chryseobacterium lactis]
MKYYHKKIKLFSSIILSCILILGFSQTLLAQSFHDTKGNIGVSGAGQLQFTLPIAMPPGIKSVAPQMNLIYTSGSGNGIAGYGWNISGITAISRVGKTVETDGEAKGVQLDYSDYYSFNGQRLILKSGEYGKDGAEYVTEKYSNVKIKSVGTYPINGQFTGPIHFEVTFEDGTQAWYGSSASRYSPEITTPLEYNIVKWKDTQGNYISYNYETSSSFEGFRRAGIVRISSISWGGNEKFNKPHFNTIDFTYIDRDLKELSYIQGIKIIQDKLLSEIKVSSDGNMFKKYKVDYLKNGTNYQVAEKITEFNSENIAANPVTFTYPTPTQSNLEFADTNTDNFENVRLTGDFNGDSYLDFVMNDGMIKLGAFNDTFTNISTGKVFTREAKVVNTLLDEEGQIHSGNGIVQHENGRVIGYIFRNNTFVKVFEKLVYDLSGCTPKAGGIGCTTTATVNEGDINGDGISDVFLTLNQENCSWAYDPNCVNKTSDGTANRPPPCTVLSCETRTLGNFIVDLKNANNPLSTYTIDSGINEDSHYQQQYRDINGDGKVDVIDVFNATFFVFEFIKTGPNQYLKKIKFTGPLSEGKHPEDPILYGDFNGDGNLDFALPITDHQEQDNWRFYMGTGKGFSNFLKTNFLKFRKPNASTGSYNIYRHFYNTSDVNRDGKSDLVHIRSYNDIGQQNSNGSSNYRTFGYEIYTYTSNGAQADGSLDFAKSNKLGGHTYTTYDWQEYGLFSPVTSQIKANNSYYDVFLFWKQRVHRLKSPSAIGKLSQVKTITQGGITTSADYQEVVPDNTMLPGFYQKVKKEYYPYFSLHRVDQSYAVSQLVQEGRKQDFRYRGMTGHLQGKGVIGYQQIARSSWYADGFESTKIWSGTEIDPLIGGVPVKEWAIRTNNESKIFPADISENNTELLSFKSTNYQADRLLNGQLITSSVSDADKPKVVTAIVPKSTKSKDFLGSTIINSSITYGDYYLPAQTVSNVNNGYGMTTSVFEYIHNPGAAGADYFIGRPKSKIETIQAYSDTKSAKEEYVYENNLLKTLKSWNRDNMGYLLETYSYDGPGNIISKVISNNIDSQTQTAKTEYDPKGRFVTKKTDHLGLETIIEYNDWGQIKKQTDPLGNTIINTYDSWGKLLVSSTNLGGATTYQYDRDSNSNITVTQSDPDGDVTRKYTNKLGQEYKASTKAFGQGQFVSKDTQYDALGRTIKESEPYFEGQGAGQWNTITYDDSVFPAKTKATASNGKQVETVVSGLTTLTKELNGYGRSYSKTADALGNIISATDKGGTIQFSYNAAGEQTQAKYAENIVVTKYDSWGRKSEFNDPSNGIYKYEYNAFGQPKKTISPKGTKEFIYNNLGQLISQKELSTTDGGQTTNKLISYSYDNKGRLTEKSGTSKGQIYKTNVTYDQQGRLLSSSENSNGKSFSQKGITYDDKGRITSYEKELQSSGGITKVTIENIYSPWNGELYQVKDKTSGKILWELKETNAKGQVLKAKLGAAEITNAYDLNGFLTGVNHSSTAKPGILQLSYSFDAVKNELKSRTTGGDFNIAENFDYDDNNRLINWTDPETGIKPSLNRNVYDGKGRIMENDQVGTIKFENAVKTYQPTGMTLNAAGEQNYKNDLIQSITYNENNDPESIDGQKGDVFLWYGMTSMRQKVTYGGNFLNPSSEVVDQEIEGRFIKFYNEDGSFEIIKDKKTNHEKHVLYIGGSPYESNIVYVKNFEESNGSFKFLHKDYIGSILAISDEAGYKLEQRHYDAWGNLTHLQMGDSSVSIGKKMITETIDEFGGLLIDRGYTSHEHFMEVGIIHMNGRLYDPLLRRFLNADENIQDPMNTQNYNKYGYVMNNPLMFNDPSGEFAWAAGFFLTWIAPVIWGAAVGTLISVGMYAIQALVMNNWSWGGFANAVLMGAVTGGVSGGLGQVFSASGFWGTFGNGALAGAGSGGVTALLTGQNFLEGVLKGAVIGGAVAGVSWVISKTIAYYRSKTPDSITSTELKNAGYDLSDNNLNDYYTTDQQIQHDFNRTTGDYQASVDNVNTEYKLATNENLPKGSTLSQPWKQIITNDPRESGYVLGYTTNRNKNLWEFLVKGEKSTILIAPNLGLKSDVIKQAVFGHEYIHAYHRYIGLIAQYGHKYSNYTESSAYHFTINLIKANGQDYSGFLNQFYNYGGKFPGIFNWTDAIRNIVNFKK